MVLLASAYDQSKYLKAADLNGDKKFKIKTVTEEMIGMGQDKEKKLVVWFTNDSRGLVCNKTNIRTLIGAYGDDTAGWVGKIIIAFSTMVDMRGKMLPGLRVRIPPPKQAAGNGQAAAAKAKPADDGLDIPKSLRRAPAPPKPAPAIDPGEIDVDDDLNDEVDF
jgi:hypothetical protein